MNGSENETETGIADIFVTASDLDSLKVAFICITLYFVLRSVFSARKHGKSAFKAGFSAFMALSIIFTIIFMIIATIK